MIDAGEVPSSKKIVFELPLGSISAWSTAHRNVPGAGFDVTGSAVLVTVNVAINRRSSSTWSAGLIRCRSRFRPPRDEPDDACPVTLQGFPCSRET